MRALATAAALAVMAAPAVGEPLADLLGQLAPKQAPAGSVEVVGWVERHAGGLELVVSLTPKGEAKLVADPGITLTPLPREGIAWAVAEPVQRAVAGQAYFAEPQTLRVPFAGDGSTAEATVEYAYCLVAYQCLLGQATVSAPAPASG